MELNLLLHAHRKRVCLADNSSIASLLLWLPLLLLRLSRGTRLLLHAHDSEYALLTTSPIASPLLWLLLLLLPPPPPMLLLLSFDENS